MESWFCKIKRRRKRLQVFLLVPFVVVVFLASREQVMDESFLMTGTCPLCYGQDLCGAISGGELRLTGWSRLRVLKLINLKNTYRGSYGGRRAMLKKLAHDRELDRFTDTSLCGLVNCSRSEPPLQSFLAVLRETLTVKSAAGAMLAFVGNSSDMFLCPSARLVERIQERSLTFTPEDIETAMLNVLTAAFINPEPLILQVFEKSNGWPFPEFLGACGRVIAVTYEGEILTKYLSAPWKTRVKLAYQVIKIADMLTNGDEEFTLYWTDAHLDNLAVDKLGVVRIVDAENIVVVNKRKLRPDQTFWHIPIGSFCTCGGQHECTFYSEDVLCNHRDVDFNYLTICQNILLWGSGDDGLLHSIPTSVDRKWNVSNLLAECIRPVEYLGRWKIKERLLQALKAVV